mmetsp:Transcript_40052/g.101737  ORF Transcript_40052/g.101737 Transcript_40052/m.101737 type:complete len:261 (+) Transcript_40052:105-887(+)
MPLQPAENCCGACPLLQGVQIIASYTVVVGTFSLLSLLMKWPADKPVASESMQVVEFLETVYHTLAFFAGLKGLIGVMFRDSRRLRVLFLYHLGELIVKGIAVIVMEAEACEELRRLQRLHKTAENADCQKARIELFLEFCIHGALFSYFAYVIWSLVSRLESGELGRRGGLGDLDQELADRGVLADPWLFMGSSDTQHALLQRAPLTSTLTEGAGSRGGGRSAGSGAPRPFSGAPRNLNERGEQPSPNEPFQGTPHRLD